MKKQLLRFTLAAAITLVLISFNGPLLGFHGENTLEGVYEFLRTESPQGSSTEQVGMLVIKGDYLCHLRVGKNREKTVQDEADEERARKYAAAFRSSNGTCGKIDVHGEKVSATWSVTLDPNDEGNRSEFIFTRDGDTLTIAPAGAPQFKFVYKKLN